MQRTKNYKLRLIEMSDTFSTEPLNQNMTDLDDALAAADSAANALAQRVTALEVHRLSAGTYTGSTSGVTVNVGFKPKAVIIGGSASNMIVDKIPAADGQPEATSPAPALPSPAPATRSATAGAATTTWPWPERKRRPPGTPGGRRFAFQRLRCLALLTWSRKQRRSGTRSGRCSR